MLSVIIYKSSSPKNKLGKELEQIAEYPCLIKDESSLVNPTLEIRADFIGGNYAYIPQFNRYYFINDIISVVNGVWRVLLHVDVLDSYINEIKANTATLTRSQYHYNLYAPDERMKLFADKFTITNKWDASKSGFSDTEYVIAVQ